MPTGDPEHDLSAALERWVEDGIAPGTVIATAPPGAPAAGGGSSSRREAPEEEPEGKTGPV